MVQYLAQAFAACKGWSGTRNAPSDCRARLFHKLDDLPAISELAQLADSEGCRFVRRFVDALTVKFPRPEDTAECFLCLVDRGELVAIGGVTPDPYAADSTIGRLRHVYVRPSRRHEGFGAQLNPFAGRRHRHSYLTGIAGAQRDSDDYDLHACGQSRTFGR